MPLEYIKPAKAPVEVIDNTKLVQDFRNMGGQILHILPATPLGEKKNSKKRGITFAFIRHPTRIELATAVQHKADCFTKKNGTKVAINHFLAGKTITLPVEKSTRAVSALRDVAYFSF